MYVFKTKPQFYIITRAIFKLLFPNSTHTSSSFDIYV